LSRYAIDVIAEDDPEPALATAAVSGYDQAAADASKIWLYAGVGRKD